MNHYECLKVTPDAPTEVIRAAYRALAGKRHPDRQGSATGGADEGHKEMVAINAAYEVLVNPELRAEYDALLAAKTSGGARRGHGSQGGGGKGRPVDPSPERETGFSETRVDIDWMSPKSARPIPLWPLTGNRRYMAIALLVLLVFSLIWMAWQVVVQHQMDKALSEEYAARPAASSVEEQEPERPLPPLPTANSKAAAQAMARAESLLDDGSAASQPAASQRPSSTLPGAASGSGQQVTLDHVPTVNELSRMSDEQLMAVLPSLGELQPAKGSFSRQVAKAHHPLDGKPLNLRSDSQLIDPLAQP